MTSNFFSLFSTQVCHLGYMLTVCQLLLCFCPIYISILESKLKQEMLLSGKCKEKRERAVGIMQWFSKSLLGCGLHHIHSFPFVRVTWWSPVFKGRVQFTPSAEDTTSHNTQSKGCRILFQNGRVNNWKS